MVQNARGCRPVRHLVASGVVFAPPSDVGLAGQCMTVTLVRSDSGMQAQGRSRDYDSILQPPGSADVFFPTDFEAAKRLWHTAAGVTGAGAQGASVLPSSAFLNIYADTRRTKTLTAYNPLIDDFSNTSFFLAESASK